jgi:hypothetical protein
MHTRTYTQSALGDLIAWNSIGDLAGSDGGDGLMHINRAVLAVTMARRYIVNVKNDPSL